MRTYKNSRGILTGPLVLAVFVVVSASISQASFVYARDTLVLEQYKEWILPEKPGEPADNIATAERVALGRKLFFDKRIGRDGNMSCATCHDPTKGWADGLPTAQGFRGKQLKRATPTIVNTGYNKIFMWDGRKKSLEDQVTGPMESKDEMNTNMDVIFKLIAGFDGYKAAFQKAYPGQGINKDTVSKAIAAFERTIVTRETPFDRWLQGDKNAMTREQVEGFKIFISEDRGNCVACHQPPNFTDDGFHNIGLKANAKEIPDPGRFRIRPVKSMYGAFKTPTLRDVAITAPYFHDGSAKTLMDVVEHYVRGGDEKKNLSTNMKKLDLTKKEKKALVSFMEALTGDQAAFLAMQP